MHYLKEAGANFVAGLNKVCEQLYRLIALQPFDDGVDVPAADPHGTIKILCVFYRYRSAKTGYKISYYHENQTEII